MLHALTSRPLPWLVFLTGLGFFGARAIVRAFQDSKDFGVTYLQSRAWVFGENPYDWEALQALAASDLPAPPGNWLLYPPPSLVLTAPFGILPWEVALTVWLAVSLALYGAMVVAVGRWAGAFATPTLGLIYLGGALAMYGLHTGVAIGQPAIPAGALLILALYLEAAQGRPVAGAFLAALSFCLKPHVGGAALAYFLLRRRWRPLFWASGLSVLIGVISVIPLTQHDHTWLSGFTDLQVRMLDFGGEKPRQPADLVVVDLNNILRFSDLSAAERTLIRATVTLALLGLWLFVFAGPNQRRDDLIAIPPFLCLVLLAVYHRTYDLIIILPLFAWLVGAWPTAPRWQTVPIAVGLAPLLQPVPLVVVLAIWHVRFGDAVPDGLAAPITFFVLPHVTWILLFLSISPCLAVWWLRRREQEG